MSLLVNKPIRAQIAVYYSEIRKAEMKMYGEKNCNALFTLLEDIITRHGIKIENIIIPSGHDRQVDFIVEVLAPNEKALQEIKDEFTAIKSGVKKISTFRLSQ